ncbi:MAG: hypothetical protein RIS76_3136 [Verrucomicrobiota bacterium]|jgi:type I restriction enzyme M protein
MASFVLANGSMSSNQSGDCPARSAFVKPKAKPQSLPRQRDIRRAFIEADLVDFMVAVPGRLFHSTQIPECVWLLTKDKSGKFAPAHCGLGGERGRRKLGTLIDRVHRELTKADLEKITSTYHASLSNSENSKLKNENSGVDYADVPGFRFSATKEQIASHGDVLTPCRYVGAEEIEDDGDPFEEEMTPLVAELHGQFAESTKLKAAIRVKIKHLSFNA